MTSQTGKKKLKHWPLSREVKTMEFGQLTKI